MIKKILIGIVIAGAIGLLAFGAVNRTFAKTVGSGSTSISEGLEEGNGGNDGTCKGSNNVSGNGSNGSGNGSGSSYGVSNEEKDGGPDDCIADGEAYGQGTGAGEMFAAGNNEPSADGTGYQYGIGSNNSNAGSGQGTGLETSQSDMDDWFSIGGQVESIDYNEWVITLDDGTTVTVYYRVINYLAALGFSVEPGDELIMMGFYDIDGDFEIGQIEKVDSEEIVLLRNESGQPLWSGGQRGGGPGH
jgi:hypothetical protein